MTAVHAFHPAENDDPTPTTADLLKRLRDQAETTRREPDRIVDSILGGAGRGHLPAVRVAHHGVGRRGVLRPLPVVVGAVSGLLYPGTRVAYLAVRPATGRTPTPRRHRCTSAAPAAAG